MIGYRSPTAQTVGCASSSTSVQLSMLFRGVPNHTANFRARSVPLCSKGQRRGTSQVAHFKLSTQPELRKRESDLATRKMYLTNFWYAASFSKKLSHTKPDSTKLLDTDVLIWRDDWTGEVVCITAIHPVTKEPITEKSKVFLVQHKVQGGSEETAISIDGDLFSACTGCQVKTDGIEKDAQRLEVWSCQEKGGFVWMFFGDKATPMKSRPAIPWVQQLNSPGWSQVHGEVRIKASHWMVIENVIDMAHVPYVHKGTVGDHAAFVDIDIKTTPATLNFAFPIENHTEDGEDPFMRVDAQATAFLPSTSFIEFKLPVDMQLGSWKVLKKDFTLMTINSVVPIDEETTCIRFCQMRNFLPLGLLDPVIVQGMKNILGEDREILEQLTPHAVTTEISLKADAPQLTLRKMRERYIKAGGAIHPGRRALHQLPQWNEEFAERLKVAKKGGKGGKAKRG